jgi:NADPH:quinone reductase-like Zn-dependent oxidoreductase
VIAYTSEDLTDGSRRWDVIVDAAGRRPLRHLRRALASRGTLAIVGGDGGDNWTGGFFRQILRAPLLSLFTGQRMRPVISKVNRPRGAANVDRGGESDAGGRSDVRPERGCGRDPDTSRKATQEARSSSAFEPPG